MRNNFTKGLCIIMSMIICISFTIGGNAKAVAESISGDAISVSKDACASVDLDKDVYTFKDKNAGVKVLVAKKDSWDNGYIADISIENTGDEALVNWHIDLKVKGEIDSVWNSEYEVKDDVLKLSYPTWKRKINSGETYTIGMKVNGTFGSFEDFSYFEDAKDVSDLYKIEYKVRDSWEHHAIIDAIITNTGDTTLRDWILETEYNADVVDIWNADIVSNENGLYRLKCKEYNADIESGGSVTFGFQVQYEGDEVILPTNSKLIAVADSKLVPTKTDKADWYKVMTNADSEEALRMRDNVKDRVKVAIIDSGVDYMGEGDEINRVDFIGDTDEENPLYDDRSGHGTGVAGMILGVNNGDEGEVEEETTEEEPADVDFSYLTDADYIEAVDTPEEEDEELEVSDEDEECDDEDYDDSDYSDYDDTDDVEDIDESDEESDNDVIDDDSDSPDEIEGIDDSDSEEDLDDDLNLFEYNELYGDLSGLNPNIDLTSLRVLDEDNEAPVSRVIEAIEWAVDNDINILNLSWGTDADNPELHNLIKKAYNKGMLIIAAAGNEGKISYPAAYDEVIAVGSVDSQGKVTADAVSGDAMELVAPAEEIIAYNSFGILAFSSGTSYAAPQVTALASILWQQDITVSNRCIRTLLRESSSALGDRNLYGYGIIDYQKAAGMYEEFINNYEETSVIGNDDSTDDVINKDIDEVPTIDEQYVRGLWSGHDKIVSGEADKLIKKNALKKNAAKVIKEGSRWPDMKASGIVKMTPYPEFHGGWKMPRSTENGSAINYLDQYSNPVVDSETHKAYINGFIISVDGYLEMMCLANNMSNHGDLLTAGSTVGGVTLSKRIVDSLNRAIDNRKKYEKKNKKDDFEDNKVIITDIGKNSQAKRLFIIGMALHTLGDYYAHQAYGLKEPKSYYYTKKAVKSSAKSKKANKYKYTVKQVDNKYVRLTHGIKGVELYNKISSDAFITNEMISSDGKIKKKVSKIRKRLYRIAKNNGISKNKNKDKKVKITKRFIKDNLPDYFDARSDNPYISRGRYNYTKKLYYRILRDRVSSGNKDIVTSRDYVYCNEKDDMLLKSMDKFMEEKNSYCLSERMSFMENHFVTEDFAGDIHLPSSDASVRIINAENAFLDYKRWQKINVVLSKEVKDINELKIYKISSDGISKDKKVVDSKKNDTFAKRTCNKNKSVVYSFIGDLDCKYMITISAKKDNKIIKSTRCFTISDDTSANYKIDKNHFNLRCGKNGEKNKHNFKYNTELVDKDKQLNYIKLFGAKSIYIDESMFNKASLSGYVGTKDSGKVIALENAKIELWDTDKLFADYKYETVTASDGKYKFSKELFPGIYRFRVSMDGFKAVEGRAFVRNGSDNSMMDIYLQSSNDRIDVSGYTRDATSTDYVANIKLEFYKGIYDWKNDLCYEVKSDDKGHYHINHMPSGYYTVVARDERKVSESEKYIDGIKVILVSKNSDSGEYNIDISKKLAINQIRIVLTWGEEPNDLDAHLVCQFSKNNSDECYYKKNKVSRDGKNVARLDHDDTHGYGKETITINKGNRYNYKYYVKNYSYRNHPGNDTLGKSNARVQVYYGNKPFPMYSLDVPQEKGIIWDVFEYDGQTGRFKLNNQITDKPM